jgi:hypothetical protein
MLVSATGPISAGVYRPKDNQFKRLVAVTVTGGIGDPIPLDAAYVARFGQPVAGQVVWIKVETYAAATGQVIPGYMIRVDVFA